MEDRHLWIALCILMNAAISQASQDISAHTGENLTIPCPIQVDSDLRILYWRKNGKTIYFSGENSNGTYSVTDTTSLVISDVSDRDAGNYSCKVVRQSLETAESDVIKVYVTDLTVSHCSSSQQGSVDDCSCHVDGTNVTSLVCTASGFPHSPAIEWTHNGKTVGFSTVDLKQFQDNVTLICNAWDRNLATVSAEKTVCIFYQKDVGPSEPTAIADKPAIPPSTIAAIIVPIIILLGIIIISGIIVRCKRKKGQSSQLPTTCQFSSRSGFSKVDKSQAQNEEDGNKATTEELLLGNSHQNKTPGTNHPDKPPQIEEVIDNDLPDNLFHNESTGGKEDVKFEEFQEGMNMMKDEDDTDSVDIPKDCNNDVMARKQFEQEHQASPSVKRDPVDDMPLVGRILLDDLHASNKQSREVLKCAITWLMKKWVQPYKDSQPPIDASVNLKSSVISMNRSMQGSFFVGVSGNRDVSFVRWVLKQLAQIRNPTDRDECEILITQPDFQAITDETQIPEYPRKIITMSIGGNPAMSSTLNPAMSSALNPAMSSTLNPAMSSTLNPAMSSTLNPAMLSTLNSSMPEINPLSDHMLAELQSKSPRERTATRNAISQIILEFIRKKKGQCSMIDCTEGFVSCEDLPDENYRLVALWTSKIAKLDDDIEYSINEYLHTPKSSFLRRVFNWFKEKM